MVRAKTQLEVRYTHILNFAQENRRILSPYLRLAKSFTVNNEDLHSEYITIIFEEDNFYIDARMDRLILVINSDEIDSKNESPPFQSFISILNAYKKLESFGKQTNVLLASWCIKEKNDQDFKTTVENFKNDYLSNQTSFSNKDISDIAITIEKNAHKSFSRIHFGPYNPEIDIPRYKLGQLNLRLTAKLNSTKGILTDILDSEESTNFSLDTFQRMLKKQEKNIREL